MLIDTMGKGDHVRHRAVIGADGGAKAICGRKIKLYFSAENVAWKYRDGTRFSRPCQYCMPEEFKMYRAELEEM